MNIRYVDNHIEIDDHTKKVLSSGVLENINEIYDSYNEKYAYNSSLLFQKNNVILLYPIVKYHLEEFYSKTDTCVLLSDEINGYRDKYSINAKINNLDKTIIMEYIYVNDNKYTFNINGLSNSSNTIKLDIEFKNNQILVTLFDKKHDIFASFSYIAFNNIVKSITTITKNYLNIYYENKDLPKTANTFTNITDLDCETNLFWYQLPWNSIFGINSQVEDLTEFDRMSKSHQVYLHVTTDSFLKREKYFSSYLKKNTTAIASEEVVLDEVNKNTCGIPISKTEGIYAIEVSFLDTLNPNGYYSGKLKNKYFYYITYSKDGIKDVSKNNMKNISNKEVLTNADLVNKPKILSLVKGDKYGR